MEVDALLNRITQPLQVAALIVVTALALPAVAQTPPGAAAEITADHLARAAEIAFRLDLDLGQVDAAQRHLLIARLNLALADGDWDAASAQRFEVWRGALESLDPRLADQRLPTWPALVAADPLGSLLDAETQAMRSATTAGAISARGLQATALQLLTASSPGPLVRAFYPRQLAWAGANAESIWAELLARSEQSQELLALIEPLVSDWLALPLLAPLADWRGLTDAAAGHLAAAPRPATDIFAAEVERLLSERQLVDLRLPPLQLMRARYGQPTAGGAAMLALAAAVRELPRGNYLELVGGLQSLLAALEWPLSADQLAAYGALIEPLQKLDPMLLPMLEQVDPILLSSYQQTRALLREVLAASATTPSATQIAGWQARNAQLMAAMQLGIDDLEIYLGQSLRRGIDQEVTVCLGFIDQPDPLPAQPISADQFASCLRNLTRAATTYAAAAELAGTSVSSWEPTQLGRETGLNAWQRINYWHGYLNATLDCELPVDLVNPFEWAVSARALSRFVDRWPAYYKQVSPLPQIEQVIAAGRRLISAQESAALCVEQGPLRAVLVDYADALGNNVEAMATAVGALRAELLAPGADVDLAKPAGQATAFRPDQLMVGPCGGQPSCGMKDELAASPALLSLFEQPYLIAHQIGAGEVSLCYDNVRWVDRRAELPPVRQQAMANYFGRLAFDLHGRFGARVEPVLSLRLTSRLEHEYLFGANTDEVLSNDCPRDLVDTQVRGELMPRRIQLVPRRLTYVTAERAAPIRLFAQHWEDGEQWREALATNRGVEVLSRTPGAQFEQALDERLATLNEQFDRTLYGWMLYDNPMGTDSGATQLSESSRELDLYRAIAERIARLTAPVGFVEHAPLRASLRGSERLLDRGQILRAQGNRMPVDMLLPAAERYLQQAQRAWRDPSHSRGIQVDPLIGSTLLELVSLQRRVALLQ